MTDQTKNLYVVGTDTGAGKTVLSLLLMQYFYRQGHFPFYLKPVQTGCQGPYDADSDARFIYQNIEDLKERDPRDSIVYCFKNPKAPYFAASNEGRDVDIKVIQDAVERKSLSYRPVIIEAAGGLFVPVTEDILVIDTINMFKARPVIAARAGLGTINHTLLTIEALRSRDIAPAGVVFLEVGEDETSQELVDENIEAVERFSGITVAGVIRKITDFTNPPEKYYRIFGFSG